MIQEDNFTSAKKIRARKSPGRYNVKKSISSEPTKLSAIWKGVQDQYHLLEILGEGSFGQVCKAQHITTGKIYAIKLITNVFKDEFAAKKILREIQIQRVFSSMKRNIFTTKIYDIIAPELNMVQNSIFSSYQGAQSPFGVNSSGRISRGVGISPMSTRQFSSFNTRVHTPGKNSNNGVTRIKREDITFSPRPTLNKVFSPRKDTGSIPNFTHLFLVLEYFESDLKKVVTSVTDGTQISEDHIVTIMYNTLCSINYMHSANILHRDIKPANLLIDANCSVKICDFGLSRDVPEQVQQDQTIKILKAQHKKELVKNEELYRSKVSKILKNKFSKIEFQNKKRCLSNRVFSRWYRSPEIILTEKEYGQSADMWALGCIMAELLKCSEPYTSQANSESLQKIVKNRIIFGGTSCFPLSPVESKNTSANVVSIDDQLIKIHRVLGKQSPDDFTFISAPEFSKYNSQLECKETKSLEQFFPLTDPNLLALLKDLLQFNPFLRATASDCLKYKCFDHLRIPELERPAPHKIKITNDLSNMYDYDECETRGMGQEEMMQYFKKEIVKEMQKLKTTNSEV